VSWAGFVVAVIAVAACGSSSAPVVTPPVAKPQVVVADAGPRGASPMISTPATRAMIEAPHGSPITELAVTADGTAAITADETGGMRLWPKLDGTREPCVVELPAPRSLAIARHHDAFFVAWIDSANSLALAELDDRGRTIRHGAIAQDAEFRGIVMTDLGLLAWRSDQTIVLYDFDGAQIGRLGTEPGERVVSVAANGTSAVAVVAIRAGSAEGNVVRPLQLAPLAWAKPFEAGGGNPDGVIAISKSGKRIALATSLDDKTTELRIVELTTGRLLASSHVDVTLELGFTDEDHVAVSSANGVGWLAVAKDSPPAPNTGSVPGSPFATADHRAVVARDVELELARPDGEQYLGYGLTSPQLATLGPNHGLVVGMGKELVQLDPTLAAVAAKPPAVPADATLLELHWLGGTDFAANVRQSDGELGSLIVSSEGRDPLPLRAPTAKTHALQPLHYEPSTHLVTQSFGDASVERWSADQRKIEYLAAFPRAAASRDRQFVPLAPALAGDKELVDVTLSSPPTVTWTDATTKQRSTPMPITAFITADSAGHVYAWTVDTASKQLVISVLAPGKVLNTLPHDGTVTLWPDPKGTRVAEVGANQVALYKLDGTLVWKQAVANASQVLWPSDDTLMVIAAAGIARLDAMTGAIAGARCGWGFGLQATAHNPSTRIEPLCTQLGR
jgi:WD40 repeat protein